MSEVALTANIAHVQGSRSGGWLISLVLHGGVVALVMHAAMDVKPRLHTKTFSWDVALHQAPPPSPIAAEAVPLQESVPTRTQPTKPVSPPVSSPSRAPVPKVVERRAVVQTVQAAQATPPVMERSAPQERHSVVTEVRPVASQPVHETVVAHAQEIVQQTSQDAVQPVEAQVMTAQLSEALIQQWAVPVETLSSTVEQPSIVTQEIVQTESHVAAATVSLNEQQDAVVAEPIATHQTGVVHREVRGTASAQADLGWLAESLWTRIEELKRYPRQARARRWEGKVVLEAVIRHDGTILECLVAESSGHGLLDQDAISVLRKASPLALKHPLGKEQITILVPIAYRLEG